MSDLIDRQRALDAFDYWVKSPMIGYSNGLLRLHEMLEEIPPAKQEPCDDCISRQAVLDKEVYTETSDGWTGWTVDVNDVKELPPANPAEKVGRWEWKQYDIAFPEIGNYHCSSCNAVGKNGDNYCSVCGAKMASPTGAESEVQDADSD